MSVVFGSGPPNFRAQALRASGLSELQAAMMAPEELPQVYHDTIAQLTKAWYARGAQHIEAAAVAVFVERTQTKQRVEQVLHQRLKDEDPT